MNSAAIKFVGTEVSRDPFCPVDVRIEETVEQIVGGLRVTRRVVGNWDGEWMDRTATTNHPGCMMDKAVAYRLAQGMRRVS